MQSYPKRSRLSSSYVPGRPRYTGRSLARLQAARFGGVVRSYSAPRRMARAYASRVRPVVPGYTRRVGMYGRFNSTFGRTSSGTEQKFKDTALSFPANGGSVGITAATGMLNLDLAQGLTASTRIGYKVVIKSIQLKLSFHLAAGATGNDIYHFYLVLDTATNGANPALADIFDAPGTIGEEMRNIASGNRFKILKHFQVRLSADAGVAGAFDGDIVQESLYLKCNIPVTYSGTTGVITEIKTNNLCVVAGSVNAIATCTGSARIRYTDK